MREYSRLAAFKVFIHSWVHTINTSVSVLFLWIGILFLFFTFKSLWLQFYTSWKLKRQGTCQQRMWLTEGCGVQMTEECCAAFPDSRSYFCKAEDAREWHRSIKENFFSPHRTSDAVLHQGNCLFFPGRKAGKGKFCPEYLSLNIKKK